MLVLAIVFQPALSKADSKLGFEDKVKHITQLNRIIPKNC